MLHAIYESGFAVAIRESQTIYPMLQVVHIIGLSLFAGALMFANLRVAGVGGNVPLVEFVRYATRLALAGIAIVLVTGSLMFAAFADVFVVSTVMRFKLILVLLALANFGLLWRNVSGPDPIWTRAPADPAAARKWAALAIIVLLAIVTLGKLLAYIGGKD